MSFSLILLLSLLTPLHSPVKLTVSIPSATLLNKQGAAQVETIAFVPYVQAVVGSQEAKTNLQSPTPNLFEFDLTEEKSMNLKVFLRQDLSKSSKLLDTNFDLVEARKIGRYGENLEVLRGGKPFAKVFVAIDVEAPVKAPESESTVSYKETVEQAKPIISSVSATNDQDEKTDETLLKKKNVEQKSEEKKESPVELVEKSASQEKKKSEQTNEKKDQKTAKTEKKEPEISVFKLSPAEDGFDLPRDIFKVYEVAEGYQ